MTRTPLDPRLTPARGDLAAASLRGRVEAARFVDGVEHTVCVEVADLKRAPRADAALDTQLLFGEIVTVFEEEDGWGWVQAERDGYVGYMATATLAPGRIAATHTVAVKRTFVYPAPDMKQPILAALPLEARVRVAQIEGAFARLAGHGFVFARHLVPTGSFAPDYTAVADDLIGTPYLWGGKSSLGIDCSGLVQLATARAGVAMPRDTDMQALIGNVVVERELCRGDLVFWKGHVGIMLDADTLLHANAYHMLVAREPLSAANNRIRSNGGGEIVALRRLASHAAI